MPPAAAVLAAVRRFVLALCLSAALSPAPARAAAQPGAAGKAIQLFNGRDLSGWTAVSSKPDVKTEDVWSVRDGAIHCVGHPAGYLRTNDDFTAFVLKFQWRTLKKGNSGCLIRCQAPPDKVWPKSVECQLETNNAGDIWVIDDFPIQFDPPSRLEGRHVKRLHESSEKPLGEWNQYEITADGGGKLELKVNGVVQNVAHDVQVIPGKILFQSEGAEIEFKNVELTPLEAKASAKGSAATTKKSAAPKNRPPLLSGGEGEGEPKPLLNGKDLSGWKAVAKEGAKAEEAWTVSDDGVLHCTGKPTGYLRTADTYQNFILKLDYRWTQKAGNGGVLLRMQGADKLWPPCVQAQLQDQNTADLILMAGAKGTIASDRLKKNTREPQQAKLQPYNDKPAGEWNTYEIKVVGDTAELKVNGVLQNFITGLDQVAGHVGLQSEGTAIDFRNITLTPLTSEGGTWQRLPGLEGWHVIGAGTWTYHDGIIEGQQTNDIKTYTHVVSDKRYRNLRATIHYQCLDGNSGLYVRAQPNEQGLMMGIQCEIDVARDAGGFYESYGRAWLDQPKAADVAKYYKPKQWNEMKVEVVGNHWTSWINGTKAAEITDDLARKEGVCALQIHGGQDVHVLFKDIKIEELPD